MTHFLLKDARPLLEYLIECSSRGNSKIKVDELKTTFDMSDEEYRWFFNNFQRVQVIRPLGADELMVDIRIS